MIRIQKFVIISLLTVLSFPSSISFAQTVPPDTTSPSMPTGLFATQTASDYTRANLIWNASTDDTAVTGYKIFVDGVLYATNTQNGTTSEPFILGGLIQAIDDKQYTFTVSAYDIANNESSQSASFVLTVPGTGDIATPSAPTNLLLTGQGTESVTFLWDPATDNVGVVEYKIYTDGSSLASATTTGQTTQVTINGLTSSTLYTFQVSAVDAAANISALSAVLSATTSAPVDTTAPSVPANITVVISSTSSAITISWQISTDNVGVAGYEIFRNGTAVATTTTTTHYTDSGLNPLTGYVYAVSAFDAVFNRSAKSAEKNATTSAVLDTIEPSIPANIIATPVSSDQINLIWESSSDNVGVTGYVIWRDDIQLATSQITNFSSRGLSPASAYSFAVSSFDAVGNASPRSFRVSATTLSLPDTTRPSVPSGLSATANSAKQVTISWNASSDNVGVVGYRLYEDDKLITTITDGTSYVHTNLTHSTRYTYSVSAYDAAGNTSNRSRSDSATTNPNIEEEPFVRDQEENSLRSRINALGTSPDPQLRIPILLGVEVSDIYDSWGDPRGSGRVHEGTDIHAPPNAYIVSPGDAVVTQIGFGTNGGNYVYTVNPGGERFYYAHLAAYANGLAAGQVLRAGDLIGYVGDTGNAKGGPTHLHFGIYNQKQNPFPRLKRVFTLEERVSALTRILAVSKDPVTEAKTVISTYPVLFSDARARGVVLPEVITKVVLEQELTSQICAFGKDLVIGARGSNVMQVQSVIIAANKGPASQSLALAGATGYFGPITQAALAEYHRVVNACKTPVVTTVATTGVIGARDLTIGSRGVDVTKLQQTLIKENKGLAAVTLAGAIATGYFGPITQAALAEYQKISEITPPAGYYGPKTRAYFTAHSL